MKFDSDVVIGLEVHTELNTDTKLFCGCARTGNEEPNTRTCEVCLGMPGSKPVLNKKVVEFALRLCLALNCKIAEELVFSRKSYFYPDLAKNYQITQYELPLGSDGELSLGSGKKIGLTRVHIEEDPASLVHPSGVGKSSYVLVDYNRSGNPLLEIVTKPELSSPEEARDFMKQLITVLRYLKIFDIKDCVIKADANISIKESGYVRAEIKNISSFKDIERALKFEVDRQRNFVKEGGKLKQETRGWDTEKGVTYPLRSKETEDDYGYIIDPNLVPINITKEIVDGVKKGMPELAQQRVERFVKDYKIDKTDATIIAMEITLAEIFEEVAKEIDAKLAAKWMRKELLRVMNLNKLDAEELLLDERHIIDLLRLLQEGKINDRVAQQVLERIINEPKMPSEIVKNEALEKISDSGELEKFCRQAIQENTKTVDEYKKGNENSINFLVGQVMKKTQGKADARKVKEIIKGMIK